MEVKGISEQKAQKLKDLIKQKGLVYGGFTSVPKFLATSVFYFIFKI